MFTDPGKLNLPLTWNALHVKRRLVQAFKIEQRLSDRRIGPAIIQSAWGVIPLSDSLADNVAPDEVPDRDGWESWAREASGATGAEVSRMIEALNWPGAILAVHGGAGRTQALRLLVWSYCAASGRNAGALLRSRAWSYETFARNVGRGAERIAACLNARDVAVR